MITHISGQTHLNEFDDLLRVAQQGSDVVYEIQTAIGEIRLLWALLVSADSSSPGRNTHSRFDVFCLGWTIVGQLLLVPRFKLEPALKMCCDSSVRATQRVESEDEASEVNRNSLLIPATYRLLCQISRSSFEAILVAICRGRFDACASCVSTGASTRASSGASIGF